MHLYELSDVYRQLMATYEENPDQEHLKTQLTNLSDQFEEKAENLGKLIKELEAETTAIKNEVDRLANRKRIVENKIKWLEGYIFQEMQTAGKDKIPGQLVTLSLRKAPISVVIIDQSLIPEKFLRVIPEVKEADKNALIADFKSTGEVQPGVEYITDKKTLQIK